MASVSNVESSNLSSLSILTVIPLEVSYTLCTIYVPLCTID